jgi:hypothetical protein
MNMEERVVRCSRGDLEESRECNLTWREEEEEEE